MGCETSISVCSLSIYIYIYIEVFIIYLTFSIPPIYFDGLRNIYFDGLRNIYFDGLVFSVINQGLRKIEMKGIAIFIVLLYVGVGCRMS
jgi:hypothetical protein